MFFVSLVPFFAICTRSFPAVKEGNYSDVFVTFPLVFFWLIALIGENGTINSGFCLVGGTYRREWNHQQKISLG